MLCQMFNYKRNEPCSNKAIAIVQHDHHIGPTYVCSGHALVEYKYHVLRDGAQVSFRPLQKGKAKN
jgi:hypothetical protein